MCLGMDNLIRSAKLTDASAICDIYNYYIKHTSISFEYEPVSVAAMQTRIKNTTAKYSWLVYEEQGEIIAYVYANLWKTREAYQFVLESTIYASHKMTTKGVGTKLYQALFDALDEYPEEQRIKSLMAVIALPNDTSIALHKKMGFVEAGYFKDVGNKFDDWIDVAYYQKLLF